MSNHEQIRALLASLRGLPWMPDITDDCVYVWGRQNGGQVMVAEIRGYGAGLPQEAHTKFIAAAPELVETLLAECERLTAQNAKLELRWKRTDKRRRASLQSEMTAYRKLSKAWQTNRQIERECQNLRDKVERMKSQVGRAEAERDAATARAERAEAALAKVRAYADEQGRIYHRKWKTEGDMYNQGMSDAYDDIDCTIEAEMAGGAKNKTEAGDAA